MRNIVKKYTSIILERKDHIIDKIPSLTQDEKEEIKKFFHRKSNMENLIDWNKWRKLTYADFEKIMREKTKSEKKRELQKLRRQGLKGMKEGEDYIEVRLKNKDYIAFIPLNPNAARVFASKHFGNCHGQWCIGNSQAEKYFYSEAVDQHLIPVIVIGDGEKYVVMIDARNGSVNSIWDKYNKRPMHGEVIPNFSIKNELLTPKLKKLYKEIDDTIWNTPPGDAPEGVPQDDYEDAVSAYDSIVNDIHSSLSSILASYQSHMEDMESEKDSFISDLTIAIEELEEEKTTILNSDKRIRDRIESIRQALIMNPNGTDYDNQGNPVWVIRDVEYTKKEIEAYIKEFQKYVKNNKDIQSKVDDIDNKINYYEGIIDEVKDMGIHEFIEWWYTKEYNFNDISNIHVYEHEFDYNVSYFHANDSDYDEYFEFMEKYTSVEPDREGLQETYYELEGEARIGESISKNDIRDSIQYDDIIDPRELDIDFIRR